jgi:two-component system response regulator RegA
MKATERRLLIVEDDRNFRETMIVEFTDRGYQVESASSLKDLAERCKSVFDFAIVDMKLGSESGIEAIQTIMEKNSSCRIVVLTGYGSIATAVKAVRMGAIDYLTKPSSVDLLEQCMLGFMPEEPSISPDESGPSLAKLEREHIERILQDCGGNVTKAAQKLGIHRQSLQRKLKKFPVSK